MESKRCFELDCMQEIKYTCKLHFPEIYLCERHWEKHKYIDNLDHSFILYEGTKQAILEFLSEEIRKRDELKKKVIEFFKEQFLIYESSLRRFHSAEASETYLLNSYFEKINKAQSIQLNEQDKILRLLTLPPDEAINEIEQMIPQNSIVFDNPNLFCCLDEEIEKKIEFLCNEKLNNKFKDINKKVEALENTRNLEKYNIDSQINNFKSSISDLKNEIENIKGNFKNNKEEKKVTEIRGSLPNHEKRLKVIENLIAEAKSRELKIERSRIFEKQINPEIEKIFRANYTSLFEGYLKDIYSSNQALVQDYHDYTEAYAKKVSLYLTTSVNNETNLLIYDTEIEVEHTVVLKPLEQLNTHEPPNINESLNNGTCIVQLPNGELFCFGKNPPSNICLMIGIDYKYRKLLSGISCSWSSGVYYNENIYCFGGFNNGFLNLSEKFDLLSNQWVKLKPLPEEDHKCHCIIFNDDILISGFNSDKLLRYSIKSNTFEQINFVFAEKTRKILINKDVLYLIECRGKIYESENGNEKVWKQVGSAEIISSPNQIFYSCNKGVIYIGCRHEYKYYMFYPKLNEIREIRGIPKGIAK